MTILMVVEDDPDVQFLIEALFAKDSRCSVSGIAPSAEEALEMVRTSDPEIIVLDQGLAGNLTGIEAAPQFKVLAPQAKIILFTAHAELRAPAEAEPSIDAFLLKTDAMQLLAMAHRLADFGPLPA